MHFNNLPLRRGSGSLKWDKFPHLEPYWVADMDFLSADAIRETLIERAQHQVFGYAWPTPSLIEAISDYLINTHKVHDFDPDWLVHLPGCVPGLSLSARCACQPGEALMTAVPIYPPFLHVAKDAHARTICVDHVWQQGQWHMDFEQMQAKAANDCKLFILSNPQNPLGRVFAPAEITRLAEFCADNDMLLCSDEIHCDLILDKEVSHFSALRLPEELRKHTITLMAPSKTYNIAGLGYSFAVIPDAKLRARFIAAKGCSVAEINCMGYAAAEAAYRHGESWRQQLLSILRQNRAYLQQYLHDNLPQLKVAPLQATYLAWIDASALGLDNPAQFLAENAGLHVNDGAMFGAGYGQCLRFNFGTTLTNLKQGLGSMVKCFADYLD